jgi:DNA-binding NarL/FixJ family response regulator
MSRTTVVIVDDNPGFRRSARALLSAEGFDVVGEAADGGAGVEAALRLQPDLVLLDVDLPDIDGFEVAARICAEPHHTDVILTSSHDSADFGPMITKGGARGFVPKAELSGDALRRLLA